MRAALTRLLLAGSLVVLGGRARAADTCPPEDEVLADAAWLRAVSLDVLGVAPDPVDLERLVEGEAPQDILAEWLDTEAFATQVVRHHAELLWPNVSDIRLLSNRQRLIRSSSDSPYYAYLVAPNHRGGPVDCGDFEAQWDDDGALLLTEDAEGYLQEGWTWVDPYWDPENPVKVCALDAQETRVSPWGTECDTNERRYDPNCGCGPGLAWCDTAELGHNGDNPEPPVAMGIVGDLEHRVAQVIAEDRSYLELFTGSTMYVNGPLVHFYRHQTRLPAHIRFAEVPVPPELLPELDFTDADTWVPVELGPEQAGVLTSTAWLMKFQTRRARANRFYTAFLCQPFQPPEGGLDHLDDPDPPLDLSIREGCEYCHALLEPAAAHWGRWGEYGAGYLPADDYTPFDEDCAWCAESGAECSAACATYYVVDPLSSEEEPWVGWLHAYEFLEERHSVKVEEGPAWLVAQGVVDGRLPQCVARTTATWLLGREPAVTEEAWVDELAQGFAASDFDYKALVAAILTDERYRRLR